MDDQVMVATSSQGDEEVNNSDEMVQYVIYSGEGDQPIALEELRDALTKLTGQPVALQESQDDDTPSEGKKPSQSSISQDTDVGFRLNAERMVGEVSFVDDSIVENKSLVDPIQKLSPKSSLTSSKVLEESPQAQTDALKRQAIPSQITIETEFGPITLDTSKLTPAQLNGTEQITVNVLTTDPDGDTSKEVTETRGLKLPPGLLDPKRKLSDGIDDSSMQGSDFNSVLQQLTDLCSEQNPLPVQDTEKALLKETEGLEEFMSLKIPPEQAQKQGVIEMDRLESFLKSKFGDTAKIQIQPSGVVIEQSKLQPMPVKTVMCCAAHSELKNQETRRRMLPIPLDVTKCPECNKDCQNRKNLRLHIQRFHVQDFKHQCQTRARVVPPPPEDIITDIPILVENTENIANLGTKSAPKVYKCSICGEQLDTQKEYFSHMESHGDYGLICAHCGRKYAKACQLKNHIRVVHDGAQLFQCKHCMYSFVSTIEWKAHERQHETPNDGVIQCLKCSNLVPQAKFRHHMASLHRVIHKPKLDCVFCGSRFKTPEYLAAHTHQHHNFEKNTHLCPLCYKAFPSSEERDGHIVRIHKDDEIMDADIEFSWQPRDCYKRQCARCGMMFPTYARLKAHYDKHADEKNACLLCGTEFHWIVNLDQHYKSEHTAEIVATYGIQTPTMNIIKNEDGSFELSPKLGRQFSSKIDLAYVEPVEVGSCGSESIVTEYSVSTNSIAPSSSPPHPGHVVTTPAKQITEPKTTVRKHPPSKSIRIPMRMMNSKSSAVKLTVGPEMEETCVSEVHKVLGKISFDYKQFLPNIDANTDLASVKAPRHTDIVMGRPATVINLARVWSRREKGLFYMGNEAEKFRRAAATIPKKRIGQKWVEMPLFVDELSGKLLTVEGMAECWRDRAQIFLNILGRGQQISDFLPVYEVGGSSKNDELKDDGAESIIKVKKGETPVVNKDVEPAKQTEKTIDENAKDGDKEKDATEKDVVEETTGKESNKDEDASNAKKGDNEDKVTDETQWFTKKILVRDEDGVLREPEKKKTRTYGKRPPEKDIIPDIVQGIKKAKRMMKARVRADQIPPVKTAKEKGKPYTVKGKKGKPPGFNPYRDSPFKRRAVVIISDISEVIGDAKKIIVQMESDQSPERKHWKKQTARKSIIHRRPVSSSRSGTSAQPEKVEKKEIKPKKEEEKRHGTRAQRKTKEFDMVDGPPLKRVRKEVPKKDDNEPVDKGSSGTTEKSSAKESKNVQKRGLKTDSGPAAKKPKTVSSGKMTVVSPRQAVISGAKTGDNKSAKQSKVVESDKTKKSPTKPSVQDTPRSRRKPRKISDEVTETPKKAAEVKEKRGRPAKKISGENESSEVPVITDEKIDDGGSVAPGDDTDPTDVEMPTLDLEISSEEYIVPGDSPLPSTSSISDEISRETKRAMQFLPDDFDLEEASLETRRTSMKLVLYEEESTSVKLVGSASAPCKEQQGTSAGDAWDVLVNSPTKLSPSKFS